MLQGRSPAVDVATPGAVWGAQSALSLLGRFVAVKCGMRSNTACHRNNDCMKIHWNCIHFIHFWFFFILSFSVFFFFPVGFLLHITSAWPYSSATNFPRVSPCAGVTVPPSPSTPKAEGNILLTTAPEGMPNTYIFGSFPVDKLVP